MTDRPVIAIPGVRYAFPDEAFPARWECSIGRDFGDEDDHFQEPAWAILLASEDRWGGHAGCRAHLTGQEPLKEMSA